MFCKTSTFAIGLFAWITLAELARVPLSLSHHPAYEQPPTLEGPYLFAPKPPINSPKDLVNTSWGSGQCVALVQQWCKSPDVAPMPLTCTWRKGILVKGNGGQIAVGTAIATFEGDNNTRYNGGSFQHAALYLGQNQNGIQVIDQWHSPNEAAHPANYRTLYWDHKKSNNGSAFYVVLSE